MGEIIDLADIIEVVGDEVEGQKKKGVCDTNDDSGISDGDESVICLEDTSDHDNSDIINVENDSGISDGDDSVIYLEDTSDHDNSDDIIVEEDVFNTIESTAHIMLEEQNRYLEERCRTRECFVEMFNFSVAYEEDDSNNSDEEQISKTPLTGVKRKRGRSSKTVDKTVSKIEQILPKFSTPPVGSENCFQPSASSTPQRQLRERNTEKGNLIEVSDNSDEDTENVIEESPKKRRIQTSKHRFPPKAKKELSAYEKIREANIKEREDMLRTLGIKEAFNEYKNDVGIVTKKPQSIKYKNNQLESRRSSRLQDKDDPDYNPRYNDNDDKYDNEIFAPGTVDHTHDGLKKHPCKECSNCRTPDCRRCVFCRDKPKYGGRNIKKQKCELKEKCSNPIILCFICKSSYPEMPRISTCPKGERSYSCLTCDEKFPKLSKLQEHTENMHQVQKQRRKSLRLNK